MTQGDLSGLTITQAAGLLRQRQLSPVELVAFVLECIDRLNPRLNAYITILAEEAMQTARQAEDEIGSGCYRGPLHGIPISLKDLYATKGVRTTAGSRILGQWVPDFDATTVRKLKEAGAIIVGKAHTPEFACGATGLNDHFGPARNPWNPEHVSGGSSSGSAVSVAAGMALGSMGTDSGGSVRLPAALCGVTGFKPTYGLVSRYGIIPWSWSLDHAGPLTKTAEDAALLLQVVAGHDPHDPSSTPVTPPDYSGSLADGIRGMRLGVPRGFPWETTDEEVGRIVRRAMAVLEQLGATLHEISLPLHKYSNALTMVIAGSESSASHEPWIRTRFQDYAPSTAHRLRIGLLFQAVHYHRAQRVRTLISRQFDQALQEVDAIVTPTVPVAAPLIESAATSPADDTVFAGLPWLTRPYNLTGMPAVTVSCGFIAEGLPVGLQIAGRRFADAHVLQIAHAYQQATDWHTKQPTV